MSDFIYGKELILSEVSAP